MNIKMYSVSRCPICGQGDVLIVKEKKTGHLLLMCDDCESQWENPEILFSTGEPLMNEKNDLTAAVEDSEVKAVDWEKYVKSYL
jgi:hypothetical protein